MPRKGGYGSFLESPFRGSPRERIRAVSTEESVYLSVVLPAFNESQRIRSSLEAVGRDLAAQKVTSEIVIVDDGSTDGTFDTVCDIAESLRVPVTVARYERNSGKGHALKVGFELTRGRRVLFSDADLSTPIEEMPRLLAALDEDGVAIAIGSRKMAGANIEIHQPWWRESLGKIFTILARLLVPAVSDTTCGFKAFDGDVGRDLFSRARLDDWSFDAEILVLAALGDHSFREVPVRWRDEAGTKVRVVRDAILALRGLARIRWNVLRGAYDTVRPTDVPLEVRRFREREEVFVPPDSMRAHS